MASLLRDAGSPGPKERSRTPASCTTAGTSAPRTDRSRRRSAGSCSRTGRCRSSRCRPTTARGASASSRARRTRAAQLKDVDTWMQVCVRTRSSRTGSTASRSTTSRHGQDRGPAPLVRRRRRRRSRPVCLPSATRGRARTRRSGAAISIGLIHAVALRDLLRDRRRRRPDRARAALARGDRRDRRAVVPSPRWTFDRHRLAEIDAGIDGQAVRARRPAVRDQPGVGGRGRQGPRPAPRRSCDRRRAARHSRRGARAARASSTRSSELGAGWRDEPCSAPTRAELLAIVAA